MAMRELRQLLEAEKESVDGTMYDFPEETHRKKGYSRALGSAIVRLNRGEYDFSAAERNAI